MTQVYEDDKLSSSTLVDVKDVYVSFVDNGGVEYGYGKKKNASKAEIGKYKKLGFVPMHKKYFSDMSVEGINIGDVVKIEDFKAGDVVEIIAIAKGKGFQGVVKRWGFHGVGGRTHGQSDRLRHGGSIGAGTDPGRVIKGMKMPGRMGGQTVHMENKKIVKVTDGIIAVKGGLPGNNGDKIIIIKK